MATVTAAFTEVAIAVGDAASPEVFTPWCLANLTRNFAKRANITEDEVPDCTALTDPMAVLRTVRSVDYSFSAEGKLHITDLAAARAWVGGAAKNCQIDIGTASNGGQRFSGAFLLESLEIVVQNKETATVSIQLVPADSSAITEAALS